MRCSQPGRGGGSTSLDWNEGTLAAVTPALLLGLVAAGLLLAPRFLLWMLDSSVGVGLRWPFVSI